VRSVDSLVTHSRRDMASQSPVAIVLGCSDSRAPAEIVFDQGLGDLFVIRVAGNIVAPSQIDSVEFAAERFGTRLVVVMGHTQCGAIEATLEAIAAPAGARSRNLQSIVSRVRPAIEELAQTLLALDPARLRREAGRANVRASVSHLRHGSDVIERLARQDRLLVVGAELDLTTGVVDFFEGVDDST
jgi:carbonic anhydrase